MPYAEGKKIYGKKLITASECGRLNEVRELIEMGADVNAKLDGLNDGWSALMAAAKNNHYCIVDLLVWKGASVNAKTTERGWTPLIAAMHSDFEIASLLIIHGADVNMKDKHGFTALMYAAEAGNASIVQLLLEKGAYVNESVRGYTALQIAAREGRTQVVAILKSAGGV